MLEHVMKMYPVYETHTSAEIQQRKVLEEIKELLDELEKKEVDSERVLGELQDIVQATIHLYYQIFMNKNKNHEWAKRMTIQLFEQENEAHLLKMKRYQEERGWYEV